MVVRELIANQIKYYLLQAAIADIPNITKKGVQFPCIACPTAGPDTLTLAPLASAGLISATNDKAKAEIPTLKIADLSFILNVLW